MSRERRSNSRVRKACERDEWRCTCHRDDVVEKSPSERREGEQGRTKRRRRAETKERKKERRFECRCTSFDDVVRRLPYEEGEKGDTI